MPGTSHPFFGNQYTNGGYIIGSFKFPKGLTREVGERIAKIVPNAVTVESNALSTISNSVPLETAVKAGTKSKWIIPAMIIAAIMAAAGGYRAYKYFKKKGVVKVPNIGICEYCGEPLSGARLIPDDDKPYIVCKKCNENNYAHYSQESSSISTDDVEPDEEQI